MTADTNEISRLQKENEKLISENSRLKADLLKLKDLETLERESGEIKAQAEKANRIKGDFLSMMSHEIRTPMNGVVGMASLLMDTRISPEQLKYLEALQISADNLMSIINDILDFSKIESDNLVLDEATFELRRCIEESLDIYAQKAIDKGVDLLYMLLPEVPPYLVGDEKRIRQVIGNLVNNAIKFTNEGEIFISAEKYKEEEDFCEILISVKDSGIGIREDKLSRIFEAFTQGEAFINRRYGGTGLGLSIAKQLTSLMGGNIWVESTPGKGSTFFFTVKLKIAETPTTKLYIRGQIPELKNNRVLVVDSDSTTRQIFEVQFDSWGMKTFNASSAKEALMVLQTDETKFDLGIIDMQLPDMNGVELAKLIRELPFRGDIPLILVSSIGKISNLPEGAIDAQLTKPVKLSELFDLVLSVVAESRNRKKTEAGHNFDKNLSQKLPLNILLAEDNFTNQELVITLMRKMGYTIDAVDNGKKVLEIMDQKKYDIILMDVQMPVMNGMEVTVAITENYPEADRPFIIAITANAMPGDRERFLAAGMVDYISKPMRFKDLQEALILWGTKKKNQTI